MPKRRPAKKRSLAATVLLVGLCLLLLAVSRYLDSRSEPAASVSAPEAAQADAPKLEVHFLDIGQGDSALLFCGDETLLIDGGKVKNRRGEQRQQQSVCKFKQEHILLCFFFIIPFPAGV